MAVPPDIQSLTHGSELSRDEAAVMEQTLTHSPDDLYAHLHLIGYLWKQNDRRKWGEHVFWLIDHHPQSLAWVIPTPEMAWVGWSPPAEFLNDFRSHWQDILAEHPHDSVIAANAVNQLMRVDANVAFSAARKSVEECDQKESVASRQPSPFGLADLTGCGGLRNALGGMYGFRILHIQETAQGEIECAPRIPDTEREIATLKEEVNSLRDPPLVIYIGMTLNGYSGVYGEKCNGDADEAVKFGMQLIHKGIALDPSLVDRMHLHPMLKSAEPK